MTYPEFFKQLVALIRNRDYGCKITHDTGDGESWSMEVSTPENTFELSCIDGLQETDSCIPLRKDGKELEIDTPADLLALTEDFLDMDNFAINLSDNFVYFQLMDASTPELEFMAGD